MVKELCRKRSALAVEFRSARLRRSDRILTGLNDEVGLNGRTTSGLNDIVGLNGKYHQTNPQHTNNHFQ